MGACRPHAAAHCPPKHAAATAAGGSRPLQPAVPAGPSHPAAAAAYPLLALLILCLGAGVTSFSGMGSLGGSGMLTPPITPAGAARGLSKTRLFVVVHKVGWIGVLQELGLGAMLHLWWSVVRAL